MRKLKYGLLKSLKEGVENIITFGGAYSNHILATAVVAKEFGLKSMAFIRGDELVDKNKWNQTLIKASKIGMEFVFISRSEYKKKHRSSVVKLILNSTNNYWLIPEGGTENTSIQGVKELIDESITEDKGWSHIVCPCGTGGTFSGIIEGVYTNDLKSQVLGIAVLNATPQIIDTVRTLSINQHQVNWQLIRGYEAGGYAKLNSEMIEFGIKFFKHHQITLDRVYNIKSFFAAYELINKRAIEPGSKLLLIHTGGLQGGLIK